MSPGKASGSGADNLTGVSTPAANRRREPIDRDATTYIAGHRGLVGSAVWRHFAASGFGDLVGARSSELDLRDRAATTAFFASTKPRYVVVAAAKVGGILANATYPADFLADNLRIQLNVLGAAYEYGVERLLFLGSSCIYPKLAPQPISEDSLLTGSLEPTNEPYALAKICGVRLCQAYAKQYGARFISAMPTNLYGPEDNFDPETSHVLPALIGKFHAAKARGDATVTLWGTGSPFREFLHVDDLAEACLFLMENYESPELINIGCGQDLRIRDLADKIRSIVGYAGNIAWDASKPDGTPRKLLDVSKMASLGWQARIDLEEGLETTYAWWLSQTK
jgi:GDP-L-fucose synthase